MLDLGEPLPEDTYRDYRKNSLILLRCWRKADFPDWYKPVQIKAIQTQLAQLRHLKYSRYKMILMALNQSDPPTVH